MTFNVGDLGTVVFAYAVDNTAIDGIFLVTIHVNTPDQAVSFNPTQDTAVLFTVDGSSPLAHLTFTPSLHPDGTQPPDVSTAVAGEFPYSPIALSTYPAIDARQFVLTVQDSTSGIVSAHILEDGVQIYPTTPIADPFAVFSATIPLKDGSLYELFAQDGAGNTTIARFYADTKPAELHGLQVASIPQDPTNYDGVTTHTINVTATDSVWVGDARLVPLPGNPIARTDFILSLSGAKWGDIVAISLPRAQPPNDISLLLPGTKSQQYLYQNVPVGYYALFAIDASSKMSQPAMLTFQDVARTIKVFQDGDIGADCAQKTLSFQHRASTVVPSFFQDIVTLSSSIINNTTNYFQTGVLTTPIGGRGNAGATVSTWLRAIRLHKESIPPYDQTIDVINPSYDFGDGTTIFFDANAKQPLNVFFNTQGQAYSETMLPVKPGTFLNGTRARLRATLQASHDSSVAPALSDIEADVVDHEVIVQMTGAPDPGLGTYAIPPSAGLPVVISATSPALGGGGGGSINAVVALDQVIAPGELTLVNVPLNSDVAVCPVTSALPAPNVDVFVDAQVTAAGWSSLEIELPLSETACQVDAGALLYHEDEFGQQNVTAGVDNSRCALRGTVASASPFLAVLPTGTDKIPPQTIVRANAPRDLQGRVVTGPSVPFPVTATDAGSGVEVTEVRLGNLPFQNAARPFALPTGVYPGFYRSRDGDGLLEVTHKTDVHVDADAPTITQISPSSGTFTQGTSSITVSWLLTDLDPNATAQALLVQVSTSGVPIANSTPIPVSYGQVIPASQLPPATYVTFIDGVDWVANVSTATSGTFTIVPGDALPPLAASEPYAPVGISSLTVRWNPRTNPLDTVYHVQLASSPDFTALAGVIDTTGAQAAFTGLAANKRYFAVAAAFKNSVSTWGPYVLLGSTFTAIEMPTAVAFTDVAADSLSAGPSATVFSNLGVGLSAVDVAKDGAYGAWSPGTSGWAAKLAMPTQRWGLAVQSVGGKIYAIGGNASGPGLAVASANEEYDPVTDLWAAKAAMPTARYGVVSGVVAGRVYVVGGSNGSAVLGVNEEYDPGNNTWAPKAPIPTPRGGIAAGGAAGGRLIVTGGGDPTGVTEAYSPGADQWSTLAPLPMPRTFLSGASLNGAGVGDLFYALGGTSGAGATSIVEAYDTATRLWSEKPPMLTPRVGMATASMGGKVFVIGGEGPSGIVAANEVYDAGADAWTALAPMPTARTFAGAAAAGGQVFVMGGTNGAALTANEALSFGTSRSFAGLAPNTSYAFTAKARNAAGVETAEAAASTYTLAAPPAAAPFTDVSAASLTVHWGAAGNPAGTLYRVQLATAAAFASLTSSAETTATAAVFSGLAPLKAYFARVQAVNHAGLATAFTDLGSTKTLRSPFDAGPPLAAALPFDPVGQSSLTVRWDGTGNPPGTTYYAQISAFPGFDAVLASTETLNPFASFISLSANTRYYARAAALQLSISTWTDFTALGSTYTAIEAPSSVAFTGVATDAITAGPGGSFSNLGVGLSAVNTAKAGSYGGWAQGTGGWNAKAAMPTARWGLAVQAAGGKIYAIGGNAAASGVAALSTNEEYDPVLDSWRARAPMPTARYGVGSGVIDGKIYVLGGADASHIFSANERYDPAADAWSTETPMTGARSGFASGAVGGLLVVAGGGGISGLTEAYDPNSRLWTRRADMTTPRTTLAGAVLNGTVLDGLFYAVGGAVSSGASNVMEAYDPLTNIWTPKAPAPTPNSAMATASVGGKIFVLGGDIGRSLDIVERYDPVLDAWTSLGPMPRARSYPGAAAAGGRVYVLGGLTNGSVLAANDELSFGTARAFAGLAPNTRYDFTAKARNTVGVETAEAAASTFTLAAAPLQADPAFLGVFVTSVSLQWAANGNPPGTAYRVQAATTADFSAAVLGSWAAGTSALVAGLTPYATWQFRVQARNGAGIETAYSVLGSTIPRLFPSRADVSLAADGAAALEAPVPVGIAVLATASAPGAFTLAAARQGLTPVTGSFYELASGFVFPPDHPATLSFFFDPTSVSTAELGIYTFTGSSWTTSGISNPRYVLLAANLAVFSGDLAHTSAYALMRRDPSADTFPPAVSFAFPRPDEPGLPRLAQGPVPVRGSAQDANMAAWNLGAGAVLVGSGTADADGTLGVWDAGGLSGPFTLTLTAQDSFSNSASTTLAVYAGQPARTLALGGKAVLSRPRGAAFAPNRIYVGDTGNDRVRVFDAAGALLASYGDKKGPLKLSKPVGVAVDAAGNIYVADSGNRRVLKLSPAGAILVQYDGRGVLKDPVAVALAPGRVLVADGRSGKLVAFAPDGAWLAEAALPAAPGADDDEPRPMALAADAAGNLWVADSTGGRALRYDAGLVLRQTIPGLEQPEGVAVTPSGAVLAVSEKRAGRVRTYDAAAGRQLAAFGRHGNIKGDKPLPAQLYLDRPAQLAFTPAGNLLVADRGNDLVQGFGLPGTPLVLALGGSGSGGGVRLASAGEASAAVSRRIGAPEGGRLEQPDGTAVDVPGGALAEDQDISVETAPEAQARQAALSGLAEASPARRFLPEGLRFASSATITLPYLASAGFRPRELKVHYWNPRTAAWEALDSVVDEQARTVSARVAHFSLYQLLAPPRPEAFVAIGPAPVFTNAGKFTGSDVEVYNFPNPFDGGPKTNNLIDVTGAVLGAVTYDGTMLRYGLPNGAAGEAKIRVYTAAGELVRDLSQGVLAGGSIYYTPWDGKNQDGRAVASGVYLCELVWSGRSKFMKLALIKGSGL